MTPVQLVLKSGNAKTGPIPVSMSERSQPKEGDQWLN